MKILEGRIHKDYVLLLVDLFESAGNATKIRDIEDDENKHLVVYSDFNALQKGEAGR